MTNNMNKIKEIIVFGSVIYPLLMYGCNNNQKDITQNKQILEITENNQATYMDNNCLIINNIEFVNKVDLLKFVDQERNIFFKGGSGLFNMSIRYDASPYIFPLFSYWLEKKNYHPVSESIFSAKIKEIFDINLSDTNEKIIHHDEFIEYWTDYAYETEGDIITEGSFLLSPTYRLFFRPTFNGYLVDEIGTSKQYKTCFEENEYHYNNFIFNDSKASLTWLVHNDIKFLEILVREFGYDKNSMINNAILNKVYKEYYSTQPYDTKNLYNLFVRRQSNGELDIRTGLLKSIIDNTTSDKKDIYEMAQNDILTLVLESVEPHTKLTIAEKAKLLAYFACIEVELYDRYPKLSSSSYRTLVYGIVRNSEEDYPKIWEENNYYNITDFRSILDKLELDGDPNP